MELFQSDATIGVFLRVTLKSCSLPSIHTYTVERTVDHFYKVTKSWEPDPVRMKELSVTVEIILTEVAMRNLLVQDCASVKWNDTRFQFDLSFGTVDKPGPVLTTYVFDSSDTDVDDSDTLEQLRERYETEIRQSIERIIAVFDGIDVCRVIHNS